MARRLQQNLCLGAQSMRMVNLDGPLRSTLSTLAAKLIRHWWYAL